MTFGGALEGRVATDFDRARARRVAAAFLSPPAFVLGVVIGGCGTSARDEFYMIRSAQVGAELGDRSVFVPASAFPAMAGFSADRVTLSAVPDH